MSFWINDPTILFNQKYIKQIWPYSYLNYEPKYFWGQNNV